MEFGSFHGSKSGAGGGNRTLIGHLGPKACIRVVASFRYDPVLRVNSSVLDCAPWCTHDIHAPQTGDQSLIVQS